MIDKTIVTDDIKLWLFDYDNDEFERVRNLCLEEDNWLRENYTTNRLKITDHKVFYIAYMPNGDPLKFGGIKEYNNHVARAFNRMYGFPKYRNPRKFMWHHKLMIDTILPNMEDVLGFKYDLLFVSMQMRDRGYTGEQRWWDFWKNSWFSQSSGWKTFNGLVQTYPSEDLTCYQNIVYRDSDNFTFNDWNPKTMSYEEYAEKCKNI